MKTFILCCLLGALVAVSSAEKPEKPERQSKNWFNLAKKLIPNYSELCTKAGGKCVSRDQCNQDFSVARDFCTGDNVCCLPKSIICEKALGGFCTSDKVACAKKKNYEVGKLQCSATAQCCKPNGKGLKEKVENGVKKEGARVLKKVPARIQRCLDCFAKNGAEKCKRCPRFLRKNYEKQTEGDKEFQVRPWHKRMWAKVMKKQGQAKENEVEGTEDPLEVEEEEGELEEETVNDTLDKSNNTN